MNIFNKFKINYNQKLFDDFLINNNQEGARSLLKEIKFFSNKIEENTSIYKALHDAKTRLYLYKQKEDESLEDHIHNFKDLVGTIEHYWGAFSMINNSHSTKQIRIKNKDKRC